MIAKHPATSQPPARLATCFRTRLGWVALLADEHVLIATTLPQPSRRAALARLPTDFQPGENALIRRTRALIIRFFSGHRVSFNDLPCDDSLGTEFQRRVWLLTRAIPYGQTRTYGDLARAAGRPQAARAIGQCMARNPLPLIIPCHRLVGSAGDLRGFGGGLAMKRALLKMEAGS